MKTIDSSCLRLKVQGAVQGVGFRPFVYQLAKDLDLTGWVCNDGTGVELEIEGRSSLLQRFLSRLKKDKPPHAFYTSLDIEYQEPRGYSHFEIHPSETGQKSALVLPDYAICPQCLQELFDPQNRRYRYPFTNCTHCGPRFSILQSLPYDRPNTTMRSFPLC
ncbi:MAG: acylphosphatase, partial [bacterium]|nr:acylphosphatase [bacterium]